LLPPEWKLKIKIFKEEVSSPEALAKTVDAMEEVEKVYLIDRENNVLYPPGKNKDYSGIVSALNEMRLFSQEAISRIGRVETLSADTELGSVIACFIPSGYLIVVVKNGKMDEFYPKLKKLLKEYNMNNY